jgi:UDP-GlcNAc:undecaprenyl-phosphate GlcNAc-1-phosphate transferase
METTAQFIPVLIVGFAAALGLTPLSRQIAMRLGVVDKPNVPRKTHKDHKPMMGGLAIYVGLCLSLLLFSPPRHVAELLVIMGGAGLLALVGLLDDRYNLSILSRFGAMILAALLLVAVGIQIRLFGTSWLDVPLTVVWVVALCNAFNFLDNMDGLTAGLSAISAASFLLIALSQGQILVSLMAAAVLGSALGFLTYNFNPASTFMGDMGALTLGYLMATLAIKLNFQTQPLSVTWMVPVLALALPIFDINLVVWTRLAEGRSPFEGGRDHTSHRLVALGFSARRAVLILYLACAFFGGLALLVANAPAPLAFGLGLLGLGLMGLAAWGMVWIRQTIQKRPAS